MAENTVMNLKVFLRNDKEAEARRFSVDMSAVTSFVFIKEKLQTVFPTLRQNSFKITWKDKDGDEITIASDEDLITAFTEMSELLVKVLYIQITQSQSENVFMGASFGHPMEGPSIICDVCNSMIHGVRYKCLQCPDYDLCGSCEFQGNHSDHIVMRLPNGEFNFPKCARKFMHHLGREVKKSAHMANKEAFRAARCARRYCAPSTSQKKPAENSTPGNDQNTEEQRPQGGCPFSAQEFPAMNLNDLIGLGDLAKQHLPTLVDFLQNVAAPPAPNNNNDAKQGESATNNNANPNNTQNNNPNPQEQMGLLSDAFRNIIGNFLIPFPKDNPEEEKTDSADKPSEKPAETVAMDVDPNNASNGQTEQLPRRDPGWTFVATNPTPVPEQNPQHNQVTEPTAPNLIYPTLVYHENPKIAEGLVKLHEMGFSNDGGFLTQLLERHNGNVAAVVRTILDSTT